MKVNTKAFGEIEISEKQKIHFKNGIFGFEDIHDFVLIDTPNNPAFYWLQAEHQAETAFVLINPLLVVKDYNLKMDNKEKEELDLKNDTDLLIFSIVTIYSNPKDITINLLGPIIINKINHEAKQIINQNDYYSVKHPLLNKKEEKC